MGNFGHRLAGGVRGLNDTGGGVRRNSTSKRISTRSSKIRFSPRITKRKLATKRSRWEVATLGGIRVKAAVLDCCNDLDQAAKRARERGTSVRIHRSVVRVRVISKSSPDLAG